jgi:alkylhydroperoxidase family enzyme
MTLNPRTSNAALFDRLRASYDEGGALEIAAMAGLFNYFNRIANAFEIEPTQPGEGL